MGVTNPIRKRISLAAAGLALLAGSAFPVAAAPATAAAPQRVYDCSGLTEQPESLPGATTYIYKHRGKRPLRIHVFSPPGEGRRPAAIFFFGGGFRFGSVETFAEQARAFSDRGYVAAVADYGVSCRDGTSPLASVEDARSAYSWLREHADELGVDVHRIVLSGGSAGAFIATAASMLVPEDERPAAVVLYSPAVDIRPVPDRFNITAEQAAAISPAALPIGNLPPTVIFHSRDDDVVPIATVRAFWLKALNGHRTIAMYEYVGLPHTFPRMKEPDLLIGRAPYDDLLAKTFEFLDRLPEMKASR